MGVQQYKLTLLDDVKRVVFLSSACVWLQAGNRSPGLSLSLCMSVCVCVRLCEAVFLQSQLGDKVKYGQEEYAAT